MGLLTRQQILGAQDLQVQDVPVPEWGGTVRLRGMTGAERDRFEESIIEQRGRNVRARLVNVRARLVALSAIDEEGNRIFSGTDVEALGEKSAAALDRLFDVASRLSGLSGADVELLEKNFGSGPSAASGSD